MKFRKKPVVIEAITFDELVQHGRDNGANIVSGMPWSFRYAGHPITHENDQCYLILTLEGTMKFTPDDMLITGVKGEIYPCKSDIFAATYDISEQPPVANSHVAPGCEQFSVATIIANASGLPPHQQRVVEEKVELDSKGAKLNSFFETPIFAGLDAAEQNRLRAQLVAMQTYSDILGERIAAF